MPSPIAHLAAGALIAHQFARPIQDRLQRRRIWTLSLFFSISPDLDAIPGYLLGNMGAFHNQASHSLIFGMAFCLVAACGIRTLLEGWSYLRAFSFLATCYGFHLALDLLSLGPGLKLLWPLSDERINMPFVLFYGVRHSEGLYSFHHIITVINELTIIALCSMVISIFIRRFPPLARARVRAETWNR